MIHLLLSYAFSSIIPHTKTKGPTPLFSASDDVQEDFLHLLRLDTHVPPGHRRVAVVQPFGYDLPRHTKLLALLVGPRLAQGVRSVVSHELDFIAPLLDVVRDGIGRQGVVPPLPALEQILPRNRWPLPSEIPFQRRMDFSVHDKDVHLARLLLHDFNPASHPSMAHVVHAQAQQILNPQTAVDTHHEEQQISGTPLQVSLDALDVTNFNYRLHFHTHATPMSVFLWNFHRFGHSFFSPKSPSKITH